jgi:hypothetical protein
VVVSGCGSYCAPNRNIRDRIGESSVVGTWRLTEESLRNLAQDGFRRESSHRYTITFRADHTCELASVVVFTESAYIVAPCTWRLEHDVDDGSTANRLQIEVHSQPRLFYSLDFAREDGVLILWEYYSDPDLWQFLEYTRSDTKKKAGSKDPAYEERLAKSD